MLGLIGNVIFFLIISAVWLYYDSLTKMLLTIAVGVVVVHIMEANFNNWWPKIEKKLIDIKNRHFKGPTNGEEYLNTEWRGNASGDSGSSSQTGSPQNAEAGAGAGAGSGSESNTTEKANSQGDANAESNSSSYQNQSSSNESQSSSSYSSENHSSGTWGKADGDSSDSSGYNQSNDADASQGTTSYSFDKGEPDRNLYPERWAYHVLGIKSGASIDECKKAYRKKIAMYHPDKHQHESATIKQKYKAMTQKINEAKDILRF